MAIIKIYRNGITAQVRQQAVRVLKVYDHPVPAGILQSAFTQKGGWLLGTGAGTYAEFAPGSTGQYPTPDPTAPTGIKWETPSVAIPDTTNYLINGGFDFAQRQAPGTLTAISDNAYGADRWKMTRENADLQYQRNDANAESGLTSRYYGRYKKITNAGKFMVFQIVEGWNSVPLRGKSITFQAKMKASSSKTIRMAILQLQTGGTIDTIPKPIVTSWNVDSTDPTLGTNIAVITGAVSKSVTTAWQNFSVSVTVPSDSKNIICAVWSDSDFSANDTLDIAEAGLFLGSNLLSWTPRLIQNEFDLCRRYYYKTFAVDQAPVQNAGILNAHRFIAGKAGVSTQYTSWRIPTMRAAPTVTLYNPSAANAQVRDAGATADCSSSTAHTGLISDSMISVYCTGNASTAVGNPLDIHATADAEL